MKSKLKTAALIFFALFLLNSNFFAQENSSEQESDGSQPAYSERSEQEQPAQEQTDSQNEGEEDEYISEDGDNAPDEYEDDEEYVYMQNAPGDQFINVRIAPNFPLNFDDKLKIGGMVTVSYNRFLTSWLALGVEVAFGYNPTIGSNILTYIPITIATTFLPTIKKFEFPITFNVGMAVENYLSNTYFPGLVLRGGLGAYYRISESWSAGIEGFFTYMPQWYAKQPEKNDFLNMASVSAGVKYHF